MNKIKFVAYVSLGRNLDNIRVPFYVLSEEDEMSLSYDDVYDASIEETQKKYPEDEFPKMEIESINIILDDCNSEYPVVPEDYEKIGITVPQSKKFLVLPWGRWSLTPECKLFLKMVEYGFLDKYAEFNKESMRELLDMADEILNKRK